MSLNSNGGTNAQHTASLVAQGFIKQAETREIPEGLEYLFSLYKEIRFSRSEAEIDSSGNRSISLIPREAITFSVLNEYQTLTGFNLSPIESSALLSIDAIYNQSSE